jgi:hypothetical protein
MFPKLATVVAIGRRPFKVDMVISVVIDLSFSI